MFRNSLLKIFILVIILWPESLSVIFYPEKNIKEGRKWSLNYIKILRVKNASKLDLNLYLVTVT